MRNSLTGYWDSRCPPDQCVEEPAIECIRLYSEAAEKSKSTMDTCAVCYEIALHDDLKDLRQKISLFENSLQITVREMRRKQELVQTLSEALIRGEMCESDFIWERHANGALVLKIWEIQDNLSSNRHLLEECKGEVEIKHEKGPMQRADERFERHPSHYYGNHFDINETERCDIHPRHFPPDVLTSDELPLQLKHESQDAAT